MASAHGLPILGVLFAWWKPVNVDPMLYSGFLYLAFPPRDRAVCNRLHVNGGR